MSRHDLYNEDGETTGEFCPRCGDTFLADHGDRRHCGRCSFTEWQ